MMDVTTMDVTLGNAPVSYGVFELTVGTDRVMPAAERLLDEIASAGYMGVDLGPLGYLGLGPELGERLAGRGLGLCGCYIVLPFQDSPALQEALSSLDGVLDVFAAVAGHVPGPPPRPTLAATPSPGHKQHPGQAEADHSLGLDDAGWRAFGLGLQGVVDRCRERGFQPTFHPHVGTWVEAHWEIARVLELTDVGLCVDTGHLLVAGTKPEAVIHEWGGRINHVHLKDARLAVLRDLIDEGGDARQVWERGVFCALGRGDLDTKAVLDGLGRIGYRGWIVVEQDVIANSDRDVEDAVANQVANRQFLAELGL